MLAALVGWVVAVTLALRGADPGLSPFLVTTYSLALGTVAGRLLPTLASPRTLDLILTVTVALLVVTQLLRGGAGGWPLGYANANAALAVQLTALAGLRAVSAIGWRRAGLIGLAVVSYVQTLRAESVIGAGVGAGVLLLVLVPWLTRWLGRFTAALAGLAILAAAALNAGIAAQAPWAARADGLFDSTRTELWRSAYLLWRDSPWVGRGAGAFIDATPFPDADTEMAHSGLLQLAAEAGAVGVGLLALVVAAGLLIASRNRRSPAALGCVAWTALSVHGLFDHVQDFSWVMIAAGCVLGLASSEEFHVAQGERPVTRDRR